MESASRRKKRGVTYNYHSSSDAAAWGGNPLFVSVRALCRSGDSRGESGQVKPLPEIALALPSTSDTFFQVPQTKTESASPVLLERRFPFRENGSALEPGGAVWHRPPVKLPRLFLLAATLALFSGCIGYTKFRATNLRGELIAEWTGRGLFYPVSGGYRINAVERISGPPFSLVSRYPDGRHATVTGAHIERWHTHQPLWLYELEHPDYPTENRSEREVQHYGAGRE